MCRVRQVALLDLISGKALPILRSMAPTDTLISEHRPLLAGLQRVADLEIDGTFPLGLANNAISEARDILRDLSTARDNGDAEGVLFCVEDAEQLLFYNGREGYDPHAGLAGWYIVGIAASGHDPGSIR
jgi:hypothetical protein